MKICDYDCPHASFPDERMLGACRTMAGVFCRKLGKVVTRHVPCAAAGERPAGKARSKGPPKTRRGKARR